MTRPSLSLAILPIILSTLAGCAASTTVQSNQPVTPVAVDVTPATVIFGTCPQKPVYPEAAKQEKRHGNVALAFHVDADGTLLESKVKHSSGHADLDEAARVGLAICKFKAATENGKPVRGWAEVKYRWVPATE